MSNSVDAPLGFFISAERRRRRVRLTDRSGAELFASTSLAPVLDATVSFLASLFPAAEGLIRFRVRALLSDRDAALLAAPLTFQPPISTQRLFESDYKLLHRLAVDVDSDARIVCSSVPLRSPALTRRALEGPFVETCVPTQITQIAIYPNSAEMSPAAIAASLASTALSGTRSQVLAAVSVLMQRSLVVNVGLGRGDLARLFDV